MLVTGTGAPEGGHHHPHQRHNYHQHHHRHHSGSSLKAGAGSPGGGGGGGGGGDSAVAGGGGEGGGSSMGFLRAPHHHKVPSPLSESISERFSMILDNCQKKIKLLQAPSSLFNNLVTKARRKDRECSAAQEQEHKLYLEEAVLERKIPETDLRQLVELPPGLGYEEWLASHTIDFFQHINLLYGTVIEYCTMSGCPDMTGPTTRQYLWFDEKGKKTRVAAPQYVDYVMTFTQKTINDESIFPTKFENDFPVSFESIVKKIHRLLFHVLAHLYHSHFREMVLLNLHAHLNCIFAHFILFNERFRLIDEKETEVLKDLVVALKLHPESESSAASTTTTTASITTATTTTTTTTTTTSSCSQLGDPETSASPTNSSSNATTTPAMGNNTLSSDGDCGSCSTPQEQQSSCPSDTTAVSSNSSSGLLSALGDTAAGGSGPPLLDAGAALDTRP
ncbi:MOB kinase activator-like 2 isoform X3 [Macrobrachium nipponense]|uniref:MOB kinase activator-like 2 isoform X3 n=1 Tax=Macrobrachium nipponense TaxID=159736 RepID=UPI0030C897FF